MTNKLIFLHPRHGRLYKIRQNELHAYTTSIHSYKANVPTYSLSDVDITGYVGSVKIRHFQCYCPFTYSKTPKFENKKLPPKF